MRDSKDSAQNILTRMKQAFGVDSGVALAQKMGIPKSTVSNWVSRGSIPFRYVMACAESTGADFDWLFTGNLANASWQRADSWETEQKSCYGEILEQGGKAILHRLLVAYGFSMQKQLGDLMGLSSGTISTWVRRDFFPGDVVVACALDTGVSLRWLATGKGDKYEQISAASNKTIDLPSYRLKDGNLESELLTSFDIKMIPDGLGKASYITGNAFSGLFDLSNTTITNGTLLLSIDGIVDLYEVTRIPGNKITLTLYLYKSSNSFDCSIDDVECIGRAELLFNKVN